MTIFITGGTGYLGSYVVHRLLVEQDAPLALLVRDKSEKDAIDKLHRALQLHLRPSEFYAALERIQIVRGDLTEPGLGIDHDVRARLVQETESILHIAATLNRKSEKACLNANLRGTLSVLKLAREIADKGRLRRYSHVSTAAVAGERENENVLEEDAIDWNRSDYDPYARTKKFCEHMARELLGDVSMVFFRPSTVLGDSRFPETTQFDMVRAYCFLADLPVLPMAADTRQDIVNVDYVTDAITQIHLKDRPAHDIYHLSAGLASKESRTIAEALVRSTGRKPPKFVPALTAPFSRAVDGLASLKARNTVTYVGSLLKVFLPYITNNTVFDNTRVVSELGRAPVPFTDYCGALYGYAKRVGFRYPYTPLPPAPSRPKNGASEARATHGAEWSTP